MAAVPRGRRHFSTREQQNETEEPNHEMVLRWLATGVMEAVKGFRRLKGHKEMPKLVTTLRARDQPFGLVAKAAEKVAWSSTEPPPGVGSVETECTSRCFVSSFATWRRGRTSHACVVRRRALQDLVLAGGFMAGRRAVRGLLVTGVLTTSIVRAQAPTLPAPAMGTIVESSSETRFQLDLHVPNELLATYLSPGWTPNVATQGPAKDCNLRVLFIDRITINGPDGKPVGRGSNRVVALVAPVKEPGGANVQLVIGGLTDDPAEVPGPFGNYLIATTHAMQRTSTSPGTGGGPIIDTQDWTFAAASGETLALHLKYERGVANKGNPTDTRFYSAKTPTVFQIFRQEQVLDILRNTTTTPPDRVREFTFRGSGGTYATLFGGTEQALSWDNILWLQRTVWRP